MLPTVGKRSTTAACHKLGVTPLTQSSLPEGWLLAKLGDITSPSKVRVEPSQRPRARYLSLEHIEQDTGRIDGAGTGADVGSTKSVFQAGDVLYGKLRPYLNKVCIPCFDGICSTDILVFPKNAYVDPALMFRFLLQRSVVEYAHHNSAGVQLPRVSFAKLSELDFPLPPFAEQRRIVATVEELLARVNAARERLAKVPEILKRFRQSVLAAACSGQLTADWRPVADEGPTGQDAYDRIQELRDSSYRSLTVDATRSGRRKPKDHRKNKKSDLPVTDIPDLPRNWRVARLEDLCFLITDGAHRTPTYLEEGVPFLSVKNVRPFLVRDKDVKFISDREHAEINTRCNPEFGDVLYTKVGATFGFAAINKLPYSFSLFVSVALLKIVQQVFIPDYAELVMNAPVVFDQARERVSGSGVPDLHLIEIRDFAIPLPPVEEQREIASRVAALFALADKIDARVQASAARVERITQAILAKAFRGELVPNEAELARLEGRDYEPASVLLERIGAERAQARQDSRPRQRAPRSERAAQPATNGRAAHVEPVGFADAEGGSAAVSIVAEHAPAKPNAVDLNDRDQVMAAIREVFSAGASRTRQQAIKEMSAALGYGRAGSRIAESLDGDLRAAVRRGILENDNDGLRLHCRTIADYTREFLVEQLVAGMGTTWWDREELIEGTARWLGFRRTGPVIRDTLKSAINSAIRRKVLESDGPRLRRVR